MRASIFDEYIEVGKKRKHEEEVVPTKRRKKPLTAPPTKPAPTKRKSPPPPTKPAKKMKIRTPIPQNSTFVHTGMTPPNVATADSTSSAHATNKEMQEAVTDLKAQLLEGVEVVKAQMQEAMQEAVKDL